MIRVEFRVPVLSVTFIYDNNYLISANTTKKAGYKMDRQYWSILRVANIGRFYELNWSEKMTD